jgi:riboflavin kinase/FMN adenylyltransferase
MKILRGVSGFKGKERPVVSLGNFDGIHLGHQLILTRLVKRAEELGAPAIVYTFDPHPLKVVDPEKSPQLILDMEDKKALIKGFGVDFLVLARFTRQFASKHPREFVEDVLVEGLRAREVLVGRNFSFGRGKRGNVEHLEKLGAELGFSVNVVEPLRMGGDVVSSSRIRRLMSSGDVKGAGLLLDKFHAIKGKVVKGFDMGKEIGFPTANLEVESELVPGGGVYAAFATLGRKKYNAVVNVGTAPTFGRKKVCVEAHLLDFNANLYGRKIKVTFLTRLRDERAFKTKEALSRQIKKDTEKAEKVFAAF